MKKSDIYLLIITLLFPAPFISGCSGSSGGGDGSTGSPVASFTTVPAAAGCEVNIQFNASSSSHENPDYSIVKYEWDFDYNGSSFNVQDTGITVNHAYNSPGDRGVHTAALRVTDSSSESNTDIKTDTVEISFINSQPASDAGGPYTVSPSGGLCSVSLDGSGSYDADAPCDEVSLYKWDTDNDGLFGSDDADGTSWSSGTDLTGVSPAINDAAWAAGQSITVQLIVTDSYGLESPAAETTIEVQ